MTFNIYMNGISKAEIYDGFQDVNSVSRKVLDRKTH